ncbi:hypothetical protein [Kordiimonas sp.]|uniref:hypothetical protein n=1 Tax=Kordiimonas sp. TaxID=1970157 RepID=UPI003A9428E4
MSQIFFKKGDRKPSAFSTLGFLTACLAAVAMLIAGPAYDFNWLSPQYLDPADTDFRLQLLNVARRLAMVAAVFTLIGFIHGASSPRVRVSWRAIAAVIIIVPVVYMGWVSNSWPIQSTTVTPDTPNGSKNSGRYALQAPKHSIGGYSLALRDPSHNVLFPNGDSAPT